MLMVGLLGIAMVLLVDWGWLVLVEGHPRGSRSSKHLGSLRRWPRTN